MVTLLVTLGHPNPPNHPNSTLCAPIIGGRSRIWWLGDSGVATYKVNDMKITIFILNFPVQYFHVSHFYRTMHYSAKYGLAIACCLSVRLSVYL